MTREEQMALLMQHNSARQAYERTDDLGNVTRTLVWSGPMVSSEYLAAMMCNRRETPMDAAMRAAQRPFPPPIIPERELHLLGTGRLAVEGKAEGKTLALSLPPIVEVMPQPVPVWRRVLTWLAGVTPSR